jgi:serine/threonine protein kinase
LICYGESLEALKEFILSEKSIGGNLLVEDEKASTNARISDVGLHGPCDNDNSSIQRYGVLPYVAPEVLCGDNYYTASDIYSFGIVTNTLATEKRPWYNRAHDLIWQRIFAMMKDLKFLKIRQNFMQN